MPLLSGRDEIREYQERYKYFYIVAVLFFVVITSRLWYLQVYKGSQFKLYAEKNRIWQEKDRSPRGLILDRNADLLVDNRLSFDIIIRPQYLSDKNKTIRKLASMLNISRSSIKMQLVKARSRNMPLFYPVIISEDVERDKVAIIESNKLFMPGVDVLTRTKRTYLYSESLAHLLGYIGEVNRGEMKKHNTDYLLHNKKLNIGDYIGKFGLEKIWDKQLRGINGAKYVVVDANGRMKNSDEDALFGDLPVKKYEPGNNLVLTIDSDLQKVAYEHFKEKKGAVIALDPRSGEVLVMLSSPSFDPTVLSKGVSKETMKGLINNSFRPFYNKTIQDHYPPGSTYKALVAVAALEEGIIDNEFTTKCRGRLKFGRRYYHCHSKWGHGKTDLHKALVKSCDVFFYRMGMKLGVDKIHEYAIKFGLGKRTGVNLPNETTGLVPSTSWKLRRFKEKWTPGENLAIAIGQSYNLVTPLQLANLYAGISTGKIYRPHLIKHLENSEGEVVETVEPELMLEPNISPETRKKVMYDLWAVANERGGTAWWRRPKGLNMAGKTGTVQLYRISADKIYDKCEDMEEKMRHHGWFVGVAPYKHPEIVVAVMAEHSCHGSSGAAPVVKDIIEAYHKKYGFQKNEKPEEGEMH